MNERADELAKRYGLEPAPASVVRLTKLVARQDADLDEIARVISQDKTLSAQLLRTANTGARTEAEYDITSVDQAILRNGMGCVLLLALHDPLQRAVTRTFQTMLATKVEPADSADVLALGAHPVVGGVTFTGRATGSIRLLLAPEAARLLASRMLGVEPGDLTDFAAVSDGLGEIVNIVGGNFKSNLVDAGLECRLGVPVVEPGSAAQRPAARGVLSDRLAFRSSEITLVVDLTVNPWSD